MENIQQMSMLEVALKLMNEKRTKQPISKLIKEVLEMKGIVDENGEHSAQLYIDITTSSKFVYMGNDEWDLKIRQSLDEWDKDGSVFNTDVVEDDEDDIKSEDYNLPDEDESDDIDEDDEDIYDDGDDDDDDDDDLREVDSDLIVTSLDDDDDINDKYINEDDYNDIMDDYEDMYDKD